VKSIAVYQHAPNWKLVSDRPVNATLTTQDHVLSIWLSNTAPNGTLIAAQRVGGLAFDLSSVDSLKVSIRTSSVSAAARIVVWTDDGKDHLILLKTYNDNQWHNEIIQLKAFGVYGRMLVAVQLGMMSFNSETPLTVSYKDLSFISWVLK
jgi:hypothetical protein